MMGKRPNLSVIDVVGGGEGEEDGGGGVGI